MKKLLLIASFILSGAVLAAPDGAWEAFVEVLDGDEVHLLCEEPNGWEFATELKALGADRSELTVRLSRAEEANPPKFLLECAGPTRGAKYFWTPYGGDGLPAEWAGFFGSNIASSAPIYCFKDPLDLNMLTVAASEAERNVSMKCGICESACRLAFTWRLFDVDEAPIREYEVRFLFDRRAAHFGTIVGEASAWISSVNGYTDAFTPNAAFEPLYSTWYCCHHEVKDDLLIGELEKAAKMGMKTVIIDDGWETADNGTDFRFSGDWQVASERFADINGFVKKVHEFGMKVMMWYSVAFVGHDSANRARFAGKFLDESDTNMGISVLDPRFPEVRAFIISTFVDAVKERDLDGLKLDFIDCFRIYGTDRAIAEDYAGRDYRHVPAAVDRLMTDIHDALVAVKPDILIEFRQSYIGPAIRQYGNMLRVADCPGNSLANRRGIANLRMISGKTAVHSDMLMWHRDETPERAALNILDSIFGTVQYSMTLATLPADHLRMVEKWIEFSLAHREALLKGEFIASHPELGYPLIEGASEDERVIAVYDESFAVTLPDDGKRAFILNATAGDSLVIELGRAATATAFDTFGEAVGVIDLKPGLNRAAVPAAGRLEIAFQQK